MVISALYFIFTGYRQNPCLALTEPFGSAEPRLKNTDLLWLYVAETWQQETVWSVTIIWWKWLTLDLLGWWKMTRTPLTLVLSSPSSGPLQKAWLSTDSPPSPMFGVCQNNSCELCLLSQTSVYVSVLVYLYWNRCVVLLAFRSCIVLLFLWVFASMWRWHIVEDCCKAYCCHRQFHNWTVPQPD